MCLHTYVHMHGYKAVHMCVYQHICIAYRYIVHTYVKKIITTKNPSDYPHENSVILITI